MNSNQKSALALAAGFGGWLLYKRIKRYSFTDRTVLITGGSRGLGLVLARQLTRQGARVALLARDSAELDRACADIKRFGRAPMTITCDVTNADDVHAAVFHASAALGAIDVLINNAGVIEVGPVSRMTRADFERALAINFWGAYNAVEAVLPDMRERGSGRIVNISSLGGKISIPHMLPYSVSKFALVGYSSGLRAELANNGITVTTVCPGLMRTGSARNADFKGQHEAEYAWFKLSSSMPLLTVSAESAARDILRACGDGDAELIISLPAKLAVAFNNNFPEMSANLISLANRFMPRPGDSGTQSFSGKDSETRLTRSPLALLTDKAAHRNNEFELNGKS